MLNLENGLVSPQFHVKYDDFFETTRSNQAEATTSAPWRKLANLKADVDSPKVYDEPSQDYRYSTVGVSDSPVGDTDVYFGSNNSEPTYPS